VKATQAAWLARHMDNPNRPQMGTPDLKIDGITIPGARVTAPLHGKLHISADRWPMIEITEEVL
jgi:hypothetical protein